MNVDFADEVEDEDIGRVASVACVILFLSQTVKGAVSDRDSSGLWLMAYPVCSK
jgi:hypothetical protein